MMISRWQLVAMSLSLLTAEIHAQGAPRWEWTVAPAAWAPSQTGWVAISPIGFPGTLSNAGGAFVLDVSARREQWSYLLDGYYLGLNQPYYTVNNNPGGATPDSGGLTGKQWTLAAIAMRRVVHWLELGVGLEANGVHGTGMVYAKTGNGTAPVPFTASASQTVIWALPTVGARWTPVDAGHWHLTLFGAAGWLGNDNRSYQLVPSVGYRPGSGMEIDARYRANYTKYISGDIQHQFTYDVRLSGPELALAMRF